MERKNFSVAVPLSLTPFWLLPAVDVDLYIHEQKSKGRINLVDIVHDRLQGVYASLTVIYTDVSKDSESGKTGFAFAIPKLSVFRKQRACDH